MIFFLLNDVIIIISINITNAVLFLATLFTIYSVVDSECNAYGKEAAASLHFRNVCEENLNTVLND